MERVVGHGRNLQSYMVCAKTIESRSNLTVDVYLKMAERLTGCAVWNVKSVRGRSGGGGNFTARVARGYVMSNENSIDFWNVVSGFGMFPYLKVILKGWFWRMVGDDFFVIVVVRMPGSIVEMGVYLMVLRVGCGIHVCNDTNKKTPARERQSLYYRLTSKPSATD